MIMIEDGINYTILSYDWYNVKRELQNHSIPYWGEASYWGRDGECWTTFSVHAKNGLHVCGLASRREAGHGKAIMIMLMAATVMAIVLTLLSSIIKIL
jgi:hypothetical protein